MSDTPQSGAEVLARIKPRLREEATYVCLRPDLIDEWEDAEQALREAMQPQEGRPGRLGEGGKSADTQALAEKVQSLEAEIEASQMRVAMRAMPKDAWIALCEEFPPREGNQFDSMQGYNRDAVVDAAVRECIVDPAFDDQSWADFIAVLNPTEWAELRSLVNRVNRVVTEGPKSALAVSVLTRHAGASRPLESGE